MKNVMKDMKMQPWSLSSSWRGIWGRGWAHGTKRKQFTVVVAIKIKVMSFIVLMKRSNGEKMSSSLSYKPLTFTHDKKVIFTLAYLIVVGCQINVHEGKWGENTKSYSSVSNSSSPYAKYFGMIFPVARSYWDPYDFQKNILQLRRTKFFFKYEGFFNLKTNCLL